MIGGTQALACGIGAPGLLALGVEIGAGVFE